MDSGFKVWSLEFAPSNLGGIGGAQRPELDEGPRDEEAVREAHLVN